MNTYRIKDTIIDLYEVLFATIDSTNQLRISFSNSSEVIVPFYTYDQAKLCLDALETTLKELDEDDDYTW